MKFIEIDKGHLNFINMDYITRIYKVNSNCYKVRLLGTDEPLEVSKEIFKKNSRIWKRMD